MATIVNRASIVTATIIVISEELFLMLAISNICENISLAWVFEKFRLFFGTSKQCS